MLLFRKAGVHYLPYMWPGCGILKKQLCEKKPVRVYMDGCFDLMHYGHANALRQAKALGDELVGVVSDEEILGNKGPTVFSMEESGLKWVDEVILIAAYAITEQFMKTLFNDYKTTSYMVMILAYFRMAHMLMHWQRKWVITSRLSAQKEFQAQILQVLFLQFL